jgi:hypothetical protein
MRVQHFWRRRRLGSSDSTVLSEFLAEWVNAVNSHGGFGKWAWNVSRHPKDLDFILQSQVSPPDLKE